MIIAKIYTGFLEGFLETNFYYLHNSKPGFSLEFPAMSEFLVFGR